MLGGDLRIDVFSLAENFMIVYSTLSLLNQSTHTHTCTQRLIQWEDGSLVNHLLAASYRRNASVECRAVCEAEGCTAGTCEHREEEKGSQVEQQLNVQVRQ